MSDGILFEINELFEIEEQGCREVFKIGRGVKKFFENFKDFWEFLKNF
jgi:hypothetical protein